MEPCACPPAALGDDPQTSYQWPPIDDMWLEGFSYDSKGFNSSSILSDFHPNLFGLVPPTLSVRDLYDISEIELSQNSLPDDDPNQFSSAQGVSHASAEYQGRERFTKRKLDLSVSTTGKSTTFQFFSADNNEVKRETFGASSEGSFDLGVQVSRKRHKKLNRGSVAILKEWVNSHLSNPYPSREVRQQLAQSSGLSENQVSSWLTNFRKRQLSSHTPGPRSKKMKPLPRRPRRNPNQLTPLEAWLSSSDDEAASPEDIERAAENLEYSPTTDSQSSSYAGSMSASSAQSAFSQCSAAMRSGPPRRGRKKIIAPGPDSYPTDLRKKRPHSNETDLKRKRLRSPIKAADSSSGYPFEVINPSLLSTLPPPDIDNPDTEKREYNIETVNSNSFDNLFADSFEVPFSNSFENRFSNSFSDYFRNKESEPVASGSKIAPIFQCTFCHKHLSSKTWKRHEETQHLPRTRWTCMLDGFTAQSYYSPCNKVCVFCACGLGDTTVRIHSMSCPYRIHECRKRDIQERTFDRKDLLTQHLKNFHGVALSDSQIMRWKLDVPRQEQQWTCGFCGLVLDNWDTRASHIAKHFRDGLNMSAWDSNHMVS